MARLKPYASRFLMFEGPSNVQRMIIAEHTLSFKCAECRYGEVVLRDIRNNDNSIERNKSMALTAWMK